MSVLREMTDSDWMGFQGAMELPDGSRPRIAEMGPNAVVTVGRADFSDDNNINVQVTYDDGSAFSRDLPNQERALAFAEATIAIGELTQLRQQHAMLKNIGYDQIC